MAKIVSGEKLAKHARKVCAENGEIFLAVSYWGKGASEALKLAVRAKDVHVVLNIEHGGTNPEELATLMKMLPDHVRVHPELHSKIYASEQRTLVGSANASAFGLNWGGTGHAEAAVMLKGKGAKAAFELAKEFYSRGQKACERDLEKCRERFGRQSLATTMIGTSDMYREVGNTNPIHTFLHRSDVFGPLPVIISEGEYDPQVLEEDWNKQRAEAEELPEDMPYNDAEWCYYQWPLDSRYRGKACLEIYKNKNDELTLFVVQPIFHEGKVGTFARRLKWPSIADLGRHWTGKVRNVPKNKKLSQVHEALNGHDYLTGWDVYTEFQSLNAG